MNQHKPKALTSTDIKRLLNLEPHPREGGFFARTFTAAELLAPAAFTPVRYDAPAPPRRPSTTCSSPAPSRRCTSS